MDVGPWPRSRDEPSRVGLLSVHPVGKAKRRPPARIPGGMSRRPSRSVLREGVRAIVRWCRASGLEISQTALAAHPLGQHLLNVASAQVRHGNVAKRTGASNLQCLLEFAGVREPQVHRQARHDVEHIIAGLAARARRGAPCSPAALANDPIWRKRYNSLRKYQRGGWPAVVRRILKANESLRPVAFYDRLTLGVWLAELSGDFSHWPPVDAALSKADTSSLSAQILSAYRKKHPGNDLALQPGHMERDPIGAPIYRALQESLRRFGPVSDLWGRLVERVIGRPYGALSFTATGA